MIAANGQYFNRGTGDLYKDISNELYANNIPNGVWDDSEPALLYPDLQDLDDYQQGSYRQKAYDNLQNMLNANMYEEPLALPVQYSPYQRYYSDRQKRSNLRKFGIR